MPFRRCRSEPQTVVPVTLRITSRASRIFGLGVSTDWVSVIQGWSFGRLLISTLPLPCQVNAFIISFWSPIVS